MFPSGRSWWCRLITGRSWGEIGQQFSVAESRTRPQFNLNTNAPDRHCGGSPCVFLDGDPYERLTNMAQQASVNEAQFLEHLILRAEAIYNFQPPVLPPPRPWWKLWRKDPVPEVPAIVADLRNAA